MKIKSFYYNYCKQYMFKQPFIHMLQRTGMVGFV